MHPGSNQKTYTVMRKTTRKAKIKDEEEESVLQGRAWKGGERSKQKDYTTAVRKRVVGGRRITCEESAEWEVTKKKKIYRCCSNIPQHSNLHFWKQLEYNNEEKEEEQKTKNARRRHRRGKKEERGQMLH